jgi:hypothetical protein
MYLPCLAPLLRTEQPDSSEFPLEVVLVGVRQQGHETEPCAPPFVPSSLLRAAPLTPYTSPRSSPRHHRTMVMPTRAHSVRRTPCWSGSPEDTDLEGISLRGPRIKHLRALFVLESGARSRSRTVKCVRVSELVNTGESLLAMLSVFPRAPAVRALAAYINESSHITTANATDNGATGAAIHYSIRSTLDCLSLVN